MSLVKRKSSAVSPDEPVSKLTRVGTTDASSPTPGLRRAPTLTLEEKASSSSSLASRKSLSKKGSVVVGEVVSVPSLPKTASVVEGDDVVTTLTRLASGSSVGRTTSFSKAPAAISKELSKVPSLSKTPLIAKGISRGGSIVLDAGDVPSLSRTSSKAKSVSSITDEPGVSLEKVVSLTKSLSKPSLTKEKSVSLVAAAVEEAAEEAAEAEAAAEEEKEEEEGGGVSAEIPLPPGGLMEIVFSFDTTGSMYSCLDQVRSRVQDMVQRLQADIPGIRIAIFAHGDYCDKDNYIVQWIDFGASTPEICKFVKDVARTGGGDYPEAYEMVLRRCQTVLSWTPGSQRSLVMIGDAIPHEANDPQNEENIDWKTECKALAASGVRIYGVQAANNDGAANFFKTMAQFTRGRHLQLDQFSNVFDIIMAICYRERGEDFLEAYEEEVREREGGSSLNKDLEGLFGALRGDGSAATPIFAAKGGKKGAAKVKAMKKLKGAVMAKGAAKKGAGKTKAGAIKKTTTKIAKSPKGGKKIQREDITDLNFESGNKKHPLDNTKFDSLVWSRWERAMFPKARGAGVKKLVGRPGFVKTNIFNKDFNTRAIYEVGVRAPLTRWKRVYSMLMKATRGFKVTKRWDAHLLNERPAKKEVDRILSNNGTIFVRRGTFDTNSEKNYTDTVKYIKENYSYAWIVHPHRIVRKTDNFQMSGGSETSKPATTKPKTAKTTPAKKAAKATKAAKKPATKKAAKKPSNKKVAKKQTNKKSKKTTKKETKAASKMSKAAITRKILAKSAKKGKGRK